MLLKKTAKSVAAVVLVISAFMANSAGQISVVSAGAPDYDIPNGHFFTQTAPSGSEFGAGFSVTDDRAIPFWTAYQSDGGLLQLGFPLTRRFMRDGLVTQVLQKAVLQWHPETERVEFVNILDELNLHGMDDWLAEKLVPPHLMTDDGRLPWADIVKSRLELFGSSDDLRRTFDAVREPFRIYGLPTSGVVDYGPMETIRLQRAALQLWKVKTDFAEPGQVVVANGGDLAVQAGLFPTAVRIPLQAPEPMNPPQSTGDAVIDRINMWRSIAGIPGVVMSAELMRAAQNHADYYLANADHPSMASIGVHREQPGQPGFTGASIGDRARAAGYAGNWIDEDINFSADAVDNVDLFVATVFHRFALLHPSSVAVGYGVGTGGGREITVIDIGLDRSYEPGVELPTVYPAPGQTDVPAQWYAYESPDPVPGLPRPVGSPLTVSFLLGQEVTWGPVSLVAASGGPVDVVVVESQWRRSIGITPVRPLFRGTDYFATVSGTVDGRPFTKSWSFTTA